MRAKTAFLSITLLCAESFAGLQFQAFDSEEKLPCPIAEIKQIQLSQVESQYDSGKWKAVYAAVTEKRLDEMSAALTAKKLQLGLVTDTEAPTKILGVTWFQPVGDYLDIKLTSVSTGMSEVLYVILQKVFEEFPQATAIRFKLPAERLGGLELFAKAGAEKIPAYEENNKGIEMLHFKIPREKITAKK